MNNLRFKFASLSEGQKILGTEDDYIKCMTGLERKLKMNTKEIPGVEAYLEFLKSCVLSWDDAEILKIQAAAESIKKRLASLRHVLDMPVNFIKTNGKEEWNSAYTRENSIIIPEKKLKGYEGVKLERLLIHELFHVISRKNPELRKEIYKVVGYHEMNYITIPTELLPRKLTNPDGVYENYYINLIHNDLTIKAVPIALIGEGKENVDSEKDILNSISVKMLILDEKFNPQYIDGRPLCIGNEQISGLHEQVGSSMDHLDQPDEILAEYFTDIVMGECSRIDDRVVMGIKGLAFI